MALEDGRYPQYIPIAERRKRAKEQLASLSRKGRTIEPVSIEGKTIARTFWGKGWCDHLESFSDYENRLPRGRTYVRNGSVCHLSIASGLVEAMVMGSRMYNVKIRIAELAPRDWSAIRKRCAGQVGSMLELLRGRLSDRVMAVVTDREAGLFPKPGQLKLNCTCPDWATMCKHVAAALYGIGSRLDERPDLLFLLRGVDPQELIAEDLVLPDAQRGDSSALADDRLSEIFGIDLESDDEPAAPRQTRKPGIKKKTPAAPSPREKTKPATSKPRPKGPALRETAGAGAQRSADSAGGASKRSGPDRLPNIRPTGRSVARLRRELKLSVPDLANALGVSATTIYRWESTPGRLTLQPKSLHALAALRQGA